MNIFPLFWNILWVMWCAAMCNNGSFGIPCSALLIWPWTPLNPSAQIIRIIQDNSTFNSLMKFISIINFNFSGAWMQWGIWQRSSTGQVCSRHELLLELRAWTLGVPARAGNLPPLLISKTTPFRINVRPRWHDTWLPACSSMFAIFPNLFQTPSWPNTQ